MHTWAMSICLDISLDESVQIWNKIMCLVLTMRMNQKSFSSHPFFSLISISLFTCSSPFFNFFLVFFDWLPSLYSLCSNIFIFPHLFLSFFSFLLFIFPSLFLSFFSYFLFPWVFFFLYFLSLIYLSLLPFFFFPSLLSSFLCPFFLSFFLSFF